MNPHYQKSYQNLIKVLIIYRYLWVLSELERRSEKGKQEGECLSPPAPLNKGGVGLLEEEKSIVSEKTASGGDQKNFQNIIIERNIKMQNCTGAAPVLEYDLRRNGLYYYRARYYDPIMGRFLQTDPLGYVDSMNLYQAFNMNGINYWDPNGMFFSIRPDDPERDRILYALAVGSLTHAGSPIFWKIFNDPREVLVMTHELRRATDPNSGKVTYIEFGWVPQDLVLLDPNRKVFALAVLVDFNNIEEAIQNNYLKIINGFGRLDVEGVITIYHELSHALELLKCSPSSNIPIEIATDNSQRLDDPIVLGGKRSMHGRAQQIGEEVYDQTLRLTPSSSTTSMIWHMINLIEARQKQKTN